MTRREYFAEYYRKHKARPKQWRACSFCARAFEGTARRVFCSDACRVKAWRLRAKH